MAGWVFKETDNQKWIEGRFYNHGGKQLAIVAVITKDIDWSAYIGTDAPNSFTEQITNIYVAKHGCKLSEKDARYYFPDIILPYRG